MTYSGSHKGKKQKFYYIILQKYLLFTFINVYLNEITKKLFNV